MQGRHLLGEREKAWLVQAVQEFNQGEYFACHETLELLWRWDTTPRRVLWQAILHVAVSLYLVQQGRWKGAQAQAKKATQRLVAFVARDEFGLGLPALWVWLERYESAIGGGAFDGDLKEVGRPFLREGV